VVRKKGNRKFVFQGKLYYWCVKEYCWGDPLKLLIISGDKKFRFEYTLDYFSDELPITPAYIRGALERHTEKLGFD